VYLLRRYIKSDEGCGMGFLVSIMMVTVFSLPIILGVNKIVKSLFLSVVFASLLTPIAMHIIFRMLMGEAIGYPDGIECIGLLICQFYAFIVCLIIGSVIKNKRLSQVANLTDKEESGEIKS
jgi:hypothetical protein